ncbi:putative cytochrome P450 [Xylaria sp. FL0064]|nr:putative cytochrome P450 [Xylaria sp. FL0064]
MAILALLASDSRLALAMSLVLSLLIWRFYTFTIHPALYPDDPKIYPYWIPYIGHLRSFFKNSNQLLTQARTHFGNSREPFALTAEDVTATYKIDNGSLSYDIFAIEVMRMIGVSQDGIEKAFRVEHVDKCGTQSMPAKHLVKLCKDYQLEQLSAGNRLEKLVASSVDLIKLRMNINTIANQSWYTSSGGPDHVTVSLYQWISDVFIEMGTRAYFGEHLHEIEPNLTRTFMKFEALSWQAMYQYPSFLCADMDKAKNRLQRAMTVYFEKPNINGNTRKAPFWILSYLLFQPDLLDIIRKETAKAFCGDEVDVACLIDTASCPRLNSVWDETTRLTAFAASVRFLTRDIELGGKTLRKGNRLMMPQRQLHFSQEAFGPDAHKFDPERFIKNPALLRHPSLRPFGGGATMCPGRNLAKRTTLAFIAIALRTFDVTLDPCYQSFPAPAEGKPSIGLVDMRDGCDLQVKLRVRK